MINILISIQLVLSCKFICIINITILTFFQCSEWRKIIHIQNRVAPNTSVLRYSRIVGTEQYYSVFGLRKFFISEDLRSSVFENFSLSKIFGLRYSDIFHKRRSSVFSIRELLEPNSTNIFLFDIQMNVCNKYIVLPSFLKSHFSTFWYS